MTLDDYVLKYNHTNILWCNWQFFQLILWYCTTWENFSLIHWIVSIILCVVLWLWITVSPPICNKYIYQDKLCTSLVLCFGVHIVSFLFLTCQFSDLYHKVFSMYFLHKKNCQQIWDLCDFYSMIHITNIISFRIVVLATIQRCLLLTDDNRLLIVYQLQTTSLHLPHHQIYLL